MEEVAGEVALVAAALNAAAGAYAGWRWWRVQPDRLTWVLVRTGQAALIVLAVAAGLWAISGAPPESGLFYVYALVPVATSYFAEQFRALSAQAVLDARGLADAQAVGRLPAGEQRSIVLQIARREIGVVALAALVNAFLALRAVSEAGGL